MPATQAPTQVIITYDTLKLEVASGYLKKGIIPTELEGASSYGLDHYLARARKQHRFWNEVINNYPVLEKIFSKIIPHQDEVQLARSEMYHFGFSDRSYHPVFQIDPGKLIERDLMLLTLIAGGKTVYVNYEGEKFPLSYFARDHEKVLGLELDHIASSWSEYSRLFMKMYGHNFINDRIGAMEGAVDNVIAMVQEDVFRLGLEAEISAKQISKAARQSAWDMNTLAEVLLVDQYLEKTFDMLSEHFSGKIDKAVKEERKNFNEFKLSCIPLAFWEGVYAFLSYTGKTNSQDSFEKYLFHPTMLLMGFIFSSFLAYPIIDKYSAIRSERKQREELGVIIDVFDGLENLQDLRRAMNLLPRIYPKDARYIAQKLQTTPDLGEVLKEKARSEWRFEVIREQI